MKNKFSILFISVLLFAILANFVFAAPLPWGIAIKKDTKECAGYWPGDEYSSYKLPPGWEAYFPITNHTVTTKFGSCEEFYKSVSDPTRDDDEKCCKKLGLTFVSQNIGESRGIWHYLISSADTPIFIFLLIVLFFVIKYVFKRLRKS